MHGWRRRLFEEVILDLRLEHREKAKHRKAGRITLKM